MPAVSRTGCRLGLQRILRTCAFHRRRRVVFSCGWFVSWVWRVDAWRRGLVWWKKKPQATRRGLMAMPTKRGCADRSSRKAQGRSAMLLRWSGSPPFGRPFPRASVLDCARLAAAFVRRRGARTFQSARVLPRLRKRQLRSAPPPQSMTRSVRRSRVFPTDSTGRCVVVVGTATPYREAEKAKARDGGIAFGFGDSGGGDRDVVEDDVGRVPQAMVVVFMSVFLDRALLWISQGRFH